MGIEDNQIFAIRSIKDYKEMDIGLDGRALVCLDGAVL